MDWKSLREGVERIADSSQHIMYFFYQHISKYIGRKRERERAREGGEEKERKRG